jgi:1-acyl-sn-glycerol-3-phosphate acyltransferase
MSERPWTHRLEYFLLRYVLRISFVTFSRYRCYDRHKFPEQGAVLVCCNHQSFLDPPLVGSAFNRRMNFLARKSLFRIGLFARIIASLDAIPLERDGLGMAGLKESLRRLKRGEPVVIFPEGTRSRDGEVQEMKPGFCVLARRSEVTILPVGIDGSFEAWPRWSPLPQPGVIQLVTGDPILPDLVRQLDDVSLSAEVERRIRECHRRARDARLQA